MKLFKVIWNHTGGIRLSYLLLTVMMTLSLFVSIMLFGSLAYLRSSYDIFRDNRLRDAYYITSDDLLKELGSTGSLNYSKVTERIDSLKKDPAVSRVVTVKTVSPVSYNGSGVSILLYNDDLLEAFPALKKLGIDFSRDPDGCILGSKLFSGVRTGKTVTLDFYYPERHTETFSVAGHMSAPYRYLSFHTGGTNTTANSFFSDGGMILMRETGDLLAHFEEVSKVQPSIAFIIEFEENAPAARKAEILEKLEEEGPCPSVASILENTKKELRSEMKNKLPLPVFLLLISAFSYFSTIILVFKKKEKERAVMVLCGCSRKKTGLITFCTFTAASVIPVLLNLLFIGIAPELEWRGIVNFDGFLIGSNALLLIVIYYIVTALIAVAAVLGGMAKHTPLTYLREVSSR